MSLTFRRLPPQRQDEDDELLSVLAVIVLSADEEEKARAVEGECGASVVPFLDWAVIVAIVVVVLVH